MYLMDVISSTPKKIRLALFTTGIASEVQWTLSLFLVWVNGLKSHFMLSVRITMYDGGVRSRVKTMKNVIPSLCLSGHVYRTLPVYYQ